MDKKAYNEELRSLFEEAGKQEAPVSSRRGFVFFLLFLFFSLLIVHVLLSFRQRRAGPRASSGQSRSRLSPCWKVTQVRSQQR